ncbi:MAG: ROK family protein, partial [candidate division FCPU426 bacterium]
MKKPSSVTLGIDLGGTNFTVAVMDASGRLLAKSKSETLASRGPADLIARLAAESLKVSAASGVKPGRIKALGIGSPGPLDAKRGLVLDPPNLPGWRRVPLTRLMARKTGFKVFLDNDANAAALGETVFGAGRGFSEVIAITLGTGVGGGIVLGGKIYSGPDSTAGELGHMSLDPKGPLCNCGQRGCLEQYASATAIARRAAQLVALARRGPLWKLCQGRPALVTGKMAHQALRLGDASAKKTWAEASWALGSAIGS